MKQIKALVATALLFGLSAQTFNAQNYEKLDYKPYPYAFVTLEGGAQVTFTDYQASKLITPITSLSVGGMFTPAIGTRLNVNGWKTKGGLKSLDKTYDFNYLNTSLDLMVNMTNIVMPKDRVYPFNLYLIGGVGLTYAWDNDDLLAMQPSAPDRNLYYTWNDDRLVHSFRAGMQAEYNICKHFSINLEVTANNYGDRFNSKVNHSGDWQLQAMAGVTFKFGQKNRKMVPVVAAPTPQPAPKKEPVAEPVKPVKVVEKPITKQEPVQEVKKIDVFFKLNDTRINEVEEAKLKELAEWLKANPKAKVELEGYADAQTGTTSYNQTISQKRAEKVTKMLVDKYGIESNRIISEAKGDKVQPFNENSKNRVVIGIAK